MADQAIPYESVQASQRERETWLSTTQLSNAAQGHVGCSRVQFKHRNSAHKRMPPSSSRPPNVVRKISVPLHPVGFPRKEKIK